MVFFLGSKEYMGIFWDEVSLVKLERGVVGDCEGSGSSRFENCSI